MLTEPLPTTGRQRMRPWLIDQINSGKYRSLEWLNEDQTDFKIPWKHAGKQDYDKEEDSKIFKGWSLHTGKYREGIDDPDPAMWKTRLRTALNKLPDIQELQEKTQLDIPEPYRVYRLLPKKQSLRGEAKTKIKQEFPCIPGHNFPPFTPLNKSEGYFNLVISQTSTDSSTMGLLPHTLEDLDRIIQSDMESPTAWPVSSPDSTQKFDSWDTGSENSSPSSMTANAGSPQKSALKRPYFEEDHNYGMINPKRIKFESQYSSCSDSGSDCSDDRSLNLLNNDCRIHGHPPAHYMQVKISYRSVTACEYRVVTPNGFRLSCEGDKPRHHDQYVDQITFPDCTKWSSSARQTQLTSDLLNHVEGGLFVESRNGDVYATRHCRTAFFWNTSSPTEEPRRLPRNETVKIFDYEQFQKEVDNHLQNAGPKPSPPHIYFGVGQRWDLMCPLRNNLISVTVTPLKAFEERLSLNTRSPGVLPEPHHHSPQLLANQDDFELTPEDSGSNELSPFEMVTKALQTCDA